MQSVGFAILLFSVAIAELLLAEADQNQATVPEFLPPTFPNSPVPVPSAPNIDSESNDNINPIESDLVASTSQSPFETFPFTPAMFSPDSNVVSTPRNDMGIGSGLKPATLVASLQTDPDPSDASCSSVGMATGRKLRRQTCRPRGAGIKRIISFFMDFFRSHPPKQPTTSRGDPEGALLDFKTGNDRIFEEDNKQMDQWLLGDPVNPSLWKSYREAGQRCAQANPKRMIAACCTGPPASLYQQQKRAETPGVDMQNCELFLDARPLCVAIGLAQGYCCKYLDLWTPTDWGYMGRDCKQFGRLHF